MAALSEFKAFPMNSLSAMMAKVAAIKITNVDEMIILESFVSVTDGSALLGRHWPPGRPITAGLV